MFKTIQFIVMASLCLNVNTKAQEPTKPPPLKNQAILGKVVAATTGEALPGAIIKITNANQTVLSNDQGEFFLSLPNGNYNLSVYYLSYKTKISSIQIPLMEPLIIALDADDQNLKEVEIVSTGYQNIPKERATGSFTLIDNKLLNRRVGSNLLNRLEGIASGLVFDRTARNADNISIRGISTIFSNNQPLIVLDNFPYEGDLNNINPNDIESISILKDAAASSIWGVRAGNGVIVMTSKKGNLNQKTTVAFNANITVSGKPDLFYQPQISSAEYVELEQFLYQKGYYNAVLSNRYENISPVIEVMHLKDKGLIDQEAATKQIGEYKLQDVRKDLDKYLYRNALEQQYQLNISGGGANNNFFMSTGYDKKQQSLVSLGTERINLNFSNTQYFFNKKLELGINLLFTKSLAADKTSGYSPARPYDRLVDDKGNALAVESSGTLRKSYTDTAGNNRLLDWTYKPFNERKPNSFKDISDYRYSVLLAYKFFKGFRLSANYLFQRGVTSTDIENDINSFYTRNLINSYSKINFSTGAVTYPIPPGSVLDKTSSVYQLNYGRFQTNYNNEFARHSITAIAGFEIRNYNDRNSSYRLYGYHKDDQINGNVLVNYTARFPQYYNTGSTLQIPTGILGGTSTDRYLSYYINSAYTYNDRYTFSFSARKDESNIFGVKSNQKGVPLWSAGLSWLASAEDYFPEHLFDRLNLRATYGYNGNVDKTTSAYLTASSALTPYNLWNAFNTRVINPPNPSLAWEQVRNINFGIDFSTKGNVLSGSVEYYLKNSFNLIANSPIAPQAGIQRFKGNSANMRTSGVDITLHTNIFNSRFKWNTDALISFSKNQITNYKRAQGNNFSIASTNYSNPLEGFPYAAMFSFKFAGLDQTGSPMGYINEQPSTNYTAMLSSQLATELVYSGSSAPTAFGGLRNTLSLGDLSVSVNISYKIGYVFRNTYIFTGDNYINFSSGDFGKRWQKPGDEANTTVPSLVYPANGLRSNFYTYSDVNVLKGDHIRLQDIRIDYMLKGFNIYLYANQLGILWRANKKGIDPDALGAAFPGVKSISIGLKSNF